MAEHIRITVGKLSVAAELNESDTAEAIFQAPLLEDKSLELFVVQLTAMYGSHAPARVKLHIRVHKDLPEKSAQQISAEEEIRRKMDQQAASAKSRSNSRRGGASTVVVRSGPSVGFGYHWGWGWPVHYPIYVPIIVPPPGSTTRRSISDCIRFSTPKRAKMASLPL